MDGFWVSEIVKGSVECVYFHLFSFRIPASGSVRERWLGYNSGEGVGNQIPHHRCVLTMLVGPDSTEFVLVVAHGACFHERGPVDLAIIASRTIKQSILVNQESVHCRPCIYLAQIVISGNWASPWRSIDTVTPWGLESYFWRQRNPCQATMTKQRPKKSHSTERETNCMGLLKEEPGKLEHHRQEDCHCWY